MAANSNVGATARSDRAAGSESKYVGDILSQPDAVRLVLAGRLHRDLDAITARLGQYSRIILTGMGASLAALQPAWLRMARAGLPAWRLETSVLIRDAPELITPDTLLLVASQSGRSAEAVALAEHVPRIGATLVALTNDPLSPLAERARVVVEIHAGAEHAVSTRSYVNTLAAAALAIDALIGANSAAALAAAADSIDGYLSSWRERVDAIGESIGLPSRLYLLGRGDSLAAAECGALILKEAAKWPAEALTAGQFRHGPLELADGRLTVIVLAGEHPDDRARDTQLVADLVHYGARAVWAHTDGRPGVELLPIPAATDAGRPLAQIVPLQLLSIAIAERTGVEPGVFRHLEKVTTVE
jgi:glucosamine--fructose-6-phosphate aminotransferase (isomerizing)